MTAADPITVQRAAGAVLRGLKRRGIPPNRVTRAARSEPLRPAMAIDALLRWVQEPSGRSAAILVSHSPLVDLGLARASGVPTREWTIEGGDR